jgi:hypothetical protein
MKIVDLGVCINNNDPKGLGRIRVIDYDDYVGGKSNIKNYEEWSKDDPFLAIPFLPNNINFIPEIKQTVKIIRYDTEKTTVNQEYIAGPFTTRFDFNSQTFNEQIIDTSYGVSIEHKSDIIKNETGDLPENSKNALSKYKDYSVSGKYGDDIVFTTGGLVLRAGKLISKIKATNEEQLLISKGFPIVSRKSAKLHLKKFSDKKYLSEEIKEETVTENKIIKYIIEYDLDDLSNPTICNFYIYQVKPNFYIPKYNSNNFTEFTEILQNETILLSESGNAYTFQINLNNISGYGGFTLNNKLNEVIYSVRNKLNEIHQNGFDGVVSYKILTNLTTINDGTQSTQFLEIHPFFFRPTSEFKNRTTTSTEFTNRKYVLSKIQLTSKTSAGSSIVFNRDSINPPQKIIQKKSQVLRIDQKVKEQTFGNITADKIYILSTDTNFTDKPIDFLNLDSYEYSQDDYVQKIDPNTYSLVRGEILLSFIDAVYNVLTTHVHNINKPYVKSDYDAHTEMERLYNRLRQELINTSIKIN